MKVMALSGYNPFNIDKWKIHHHHPGSYTYDKSNWKRGDEELVLYDYSIRYSNEPFVITCHSDSGQIGCAIAATDHRCVGLHLHAASWIEVDIPVPLLITRNRWDLTGMGWAAQSAYNHFDSYHPCLTYQILPRTTWHGHEYDTAVSPFNVWLKKHVLRTNQ